SIRVTPGSSRAFRDQLADQAATAVFLSLLAQALLVHVKPRLVHRPVAPCLAGCEGVGGDKKGTPAQVALVRSAQNRPALSGQSGRARRLPPRPLLAEAERSPAGGARAGLRACRRACQLGRRPTVRGVTPQVSLSGRQRNGRRELTAQDGQAVAARG